MLARLSLFSLQEVKMKALQNSLLTRTLAEMVGSHIMQYLFYLSSLVCSWCFCPPLSSLLCQDQGYWTLSTLLCLISSLPFLAGLLPLPQSVSLTVPVEV